MKIFRIILKGFYAIIATATVCVALIEVFGLTVSHNTYFWSNRFLFTSENSIRKIGHEGFWTYSPNANIESFATYILSNSNGWIEYKCKFETNNLGLVNTNYTSENKIDWLVLGDSITEGQGGCPWLTKNALLKNNSKEIILNGGLQGTGIQGFKQLLDWLESQKTIENVVVIAISNDFKRSPYPKLWESDLDCINNNSACTLKNGWWSIPKNSTDTDLLDISFRRFENRSPINIEAFEKQLQYYSLSYRLYQNYKSALFDSPKTIDFYPEIFYKNFEALENIRKKFPKMKLILIPQKDEVGFFGIKNFDSVYLEIELKNKNFNYSTCKLDGDDFLKIDGHPNSKGYSKIKECLFRSLSS